ncbi:hypothetical protein CJ179_22325 [Rhodococcus sp. ACS1]|uniref:Uncharacterized protein n=1 Tax=Rhodococcus koreensis TaxID=99653 RepID=A0A1H4U6B6_9NOCA|nr:MULTISPECIES: hypothetical protein [Rhodococcus]PBC45887.1 hypothetical protein CJ179_22325 [Rhodococcus sp. ACS1]SEC64247.1 hypothetical protein SAMN04490239_4863 [Rhodococcus koreensis]
MLGASATFVEGDDVIGSPQRTGERNFLYRDFAGAGLALVLVVVAFVVPYLGNETITPIVNRTVESVRDFADAAPLFGFRDVHFGWGSPVAVVVAAAVVVWGRGLAQTLSWRRLTVGVWLGSALWAMALALVDGWQRGFVDRLTSTDEYLHDVPAVTDIPATLRGFADRILDLQPDSWTTHVSGHPPGALLTFIWLDRIGLDGGAWASTLCVTVGSSAGAAVIVAVRALGDEATARRAAPFLVLAPAAIWVAVSADALFAGVVAWGIALLALSATRAVPVPALVAVAAGVLLGFGVYLSYGLTLMAIPAVAVLVIARTARPLAGALVGALAVAAVFTLCGFWWFDGYQLVQERYYQGIASDRPFAYWGWANFASLICAVGLAVPAALPRTFAWSRVRALSPVPVLAAAALLAVVIADLSALSKAETERIWLPFEWWLLSAPALLPRGSHRFWLAVQAAGALAVNHLLFTNW